MKRILIIVAVAGLMSTGANSHELQSRVLVAEPTCNNTIELTNRHARWVHHYVRSDGKVRRWYCTVENGRVLRRYRWRDSIMGIAVLYVYVEARGFQWYVGDEGIETAL